MTPDWSERPVTVPYADFSDPQTLNIYSYVRNSPVARFDADGHFVTSAGSATAPACSDGTDSCREGGCNGTQGCFITYDQQNQTATITQTSTHTEVKTDEKTGDTISVRTRTTVTVTVSTSEKNNGQVLGGTLTTQQTSSNLSHLSEGATVGKPQTTELTPKRAVEAMGAGRVGLLQETVSPGMGARLMDHKVGVGGTLIGTGIAVGCALAEPCGAAITITGAVITGGSAIYDFATH